MATFDDIVFANRHRAYGAYDLRRAYRPALSRALLLGSLLFVGTLLLPRLYAWVKPADETPFMSEVVLEKVNLEQKIDEPIVVPPPTQPAPAVATVRNLVPEVVADAPDDVPDMATVDELKEATSGPTTQEGSGDVEVIAAPEAAAPTAVQKAIEVPEARPDEVFVAVEQEPQFPGGTAGLAQFLQKNLRYPTAASRANIEGRVFVSFVVNTDGSLTDVQVLKGLGFGTDEEALRVLKAMPHWKPGKQAGRAVRVKYNLPITFRLD